MSAVPLAAATNDARASGHAIERVEVFVVNPDWRKNLVFVRVESADGAAGWGEAYTQYDRDRAIVEQLTELGRYVKGRSIFGIKNFCQIAFDDYAQRRGSLEFYAALSAIEQAMWDACGRTLGQPVYNLLGGAVRERFRAYANGWAYGLVQPKDHAAAAAAVVEQGFDAIKMDPLPKPWRTFIGREQMDIAVAVLAQVRAAVGDRVDILIDNHRRLAPVQAAELARRYEEFGIYWFEEPCQAHNLDAMAEIRGRIATPVVTGEELYTKSAFREVFARRAADIINPDVSNVGGILELREIAAMAEPHLVGVSPHNYNSTSLALAATVQASAGMPNFLLTEYFVPLEAISHRIAPDALRPVNGYIELPTQPGLGITVDEAFMRSQEYRRPASRSFGAFHSVL
ncbi:MAG TPA: mandelate racemase/muconate lactonizing enzyme family protein [Ramlibacter sp.]|uniref:mandelate racemase/muconate lactonizing enzyme family protein n=1 Tax=Ramlibacter sp. TaxID=1917967 RepID=UPI002BAD04E7|nr:mandelate racemase/muconate lactonizing enzyme family protein [Ramlibacter sp.]HVZ46812.1 mandelate racemase/muconate lactonizing enzyme family protein [Ramlibacter sp.]